MTRTARAFLAIFGVAASLFVPPAAAQPPAISVPQTTSSSARPATTFEAVKEMYCKAIDRNDEWCSGDKPKRLPRLHWWEILQGYCLDKPVQEKRPEFTREAVVERLGTPEICENLSKVTEPLSLTYNLRTQDWDTRRIEELGGRRGAVEVDPTTEKPTVYLKHGETLGVLIDQVNSLAYTAARGEPTFRDLENLQALRAVLGAAGGTLTILAGTLAQSLNADSDPGPVERAHRNEALGQLKNIPPNDILRFTGERYSALSHRLERGQYAAFADFVGKIQQAPNADRDTKHHAREAIEAALEAERLKETRSEVDIALRNDLERLVLDANRLRAALGQLRSRLETLERQHRRLQVMGEALNRGTGSLGAPLDTAVEIGSGWARLFTNLRAEQAASRVGYAACSTFLEKYALVVTPEKQGIDIGKVYSAAADYLREIRPNQAAAGQPSGSAALPQLGHPCPLTQLAALLTTNVDDILVAAAKEMSHSTPPTAGAAPETEVRLLQLKGLDVYLRASRVLHRNVTDFNTVRTDVDGIFAKESDVQKLADASRQLTARVRRASLRMTGAPADSNPVACGDQSWAQSAAGSNGAALLPPRAMSIRLVRSDSDGNDSPYPPTLTEDATIAAVLDSRRVDVSIPAFTQYGDVIPIGDWDVHLYSTCSSITVTSGRLKRDQMEVVEHRGAVVANRLFVQDHEFKGKLTKVQTEKISVERSLPNDFSLAVDGPAKRDLSYDVMRRSGRLFGAGVGMVLYTPVMSRSYGLADVTPGTKIVTQTVTKDGDTTTTTTVDEEQRVGRTGREARAGQVAAFVNFRVLQALAPSTANSKVAPGIELGFSLATSKPAVYLGGTFSVSRYLRLGVGPAWISATDLDDRSLVGKLVPAGTVLQTSTRMRSSWYVSLSVALEELNLFSSGS